MDLFTLVGKIVLDADGFSEKIDSVMTKVESMGTGLQNAGEKISHIGSKLTLGVTTPIMGLGAAAIKTAANFESTMSQVSAISGATGSDFQKLENLAKEMGETTKFSASQAAEALTYMAMAGWKTDDMLSGLPGIMNLAAASGEDLALTSDIVTDALTAFGLSASDSGYFADILAQASSSANTNVSMLGESFKYVAPVAGAMGMEAEDVAVALGLMANAGIKGTQAGTALRTALVNMSSPTKTMKNQMDALGISLLDSDGNMKSLYAMMIELHCAFMNLSEAEQAEAASAIFGKEAMSGMLAIINTSDYEFQSLAYSIFNANGCAKDMADTMNDNLSGQITLLKSQLEALAIQFATLIMPYLRQGVEWLSELCTWISGLDDGTKKMIITVAGIAAAAGPVLIIGGKIVSGIGTLITAGSKLVGGIGKVVSVGKVLFSGGAKLAGGIGSLVTKLGGSLLPALAAVPAPVWVIIGVIGAVVAAGVALYKNWDTIKQKVHELKEKVSEKWKQIKQDTQELVDGVKEKFEGIKEKVSGAVEGVVGAVAEKWERIKENTKELVDGIRERYHEMAENLSQKTEEFKTTVVEKYNEIREKAVEKFEDMKEKASEKFSELREKASARIEELRTEAAEKIQDLKDNAVTHFEELREKTTEKVQDLQEKVVTGFHNLKVEATEKISDLREKWGERFEEAREKIVAEATELKEKATDRIEEFRETAVNKVNDFKESAVEHFNEFKEDSVTKLGEVAKKGVEGFNDIKEKGSIAIENLKTTAGSKFEEMGKTIFEKFSGIGGKITDTFTKCRETVHEIVEKIKGFFDFDWKLPDIKLPHFKIDGSFSLSPPSIPHLSVDWYAEGGVMTKPTAFGINPATGNIMAGGEAGAEAIAPIAVLQDYIRRAVSERDEGLNNTLRAIETLLGRYLPQLAQMQLVLDTGATVGALASGMNVRLGEISKQDERIK